MDPERAVLNEHRRGGGHAPEPGTVSLPPLFTEDPLLRGYWKSAGASSAGWPGSIPACLERVKAGVVVVLPDDATDAATLARTLQDLRSAVESGRIRSLDLLTSDGLGAAVRRSDRFRFWRCDSSLLGGLSG